MSGGVATTKLFCILLTVLGGVAVVFGSVRLLLALAVQRWIQVDATLIECKLKADMRYREVPTSSRYFPNVLFEYRSPSGVYRSNRFARDPSDYKDLSYSFAKRLIDGFEPGRTIKVFMHPKRHDVAVWRATTSFARRGFYVVALFGGLLSMYLSVLFRPT